MFLLQHNQLNLLWIFTYNAWRLVCLTQPFRYFSKSPKHEENTSQYWTWKPNRKNVRCQKQNTSSIREIHTIETFKAKTLVEKRNTIEVVNNFNTCKLHISGVVYHNILYEDQILLIKQCVNCKLTNEWQREQGGIIMTVNSNPNVE